ncbi:acetate/propionate family kinase [Calycomorphotria hydatis]|nr:acetate kinase [Calycomorphotria hydatis]
MIILVINSGSSSLKFELFEMPAAESIASGIFERIGESAGRLKLQTREGEFAEELTAESHTVALATVFDQLRSRQIVSDDQPFVAVGHRVVHGGESFSAPMLIDDQVLGEIKKAIPLAPLHNPAALAGIEAVRDLDPALPQVAVFDTAFHQTMPPHAYRYAVPEWCYTDYGIRRYGFHGTSHQFVAEQAAEFLGQPFSNMNLITLHLGNGASVAATKQGECIDTSMGMTPLEGLIMGTRSGDLDPTIPLFLSREAGKDVTEIDRLLNKESGLKGLCGENDLRQVQANAESGDDSARLAIDAYCYRIRKYIGAYLAALGTVDAIVFTAGVGENCVAVRAQVCAGLEGLGIVIDEAKNQSVSRGTPNAIHADASRVAILVVPTDEERAIAKATHHIIHP